MSHELGPADLSHAAVMALYQFGPDDLVDSLMQVVTDELVEKGCAIGVGDGCRLQLLPLGRKIRESHSMGVPVPMPEYSHKG